MQTVAQLISPLWLITLSCLAFLILRSTRIGILSRYPALMIYLTLELFLGVIGTCLGLKSLIYWWSYLIVDRVIGSVLVIFMSREMFAEVYFDHPGLRTLTMATLRKSLIVGGITTLLLGPLVLIHRGEPGFQCWQLPFYEIGRCVVFGQVIFICSMWSKLRWLPLNINKNVKTYSLTLCASQLISGVVATMILIFHSRQFTLVSNIVVLVASISVYLTLALALERPQALPLPNYCPAPDLQILARLSDVERLLKQIDASAKLARGIALERFRVRYWPNAAKRRDMI